MTRANKYRTPKSIQELKEAIAATNIVERQAQLFCSYFKVHHATPTGKKNIENFARENVDLVATWAASRSKSISKENYGILTNVALHLFSQTKNQEYADQISSMTTCIKKLDRDSETLLAKQNRELFKELCNRCNDVSTKVEYMVLISDKQVLDSYLASIKVTEETVDMLIKVLVRISLTRKRRWRMQVQEAIYQAIFVNYWLGQRGSALLARMEKILLSEAGKALFVQMGTNAHFDYLNFLNNKFSELSPQLQALLVNNIKDWVVQVSLYLQQGSNMWPSSNYEAFIGYIASMICRREGRAAPERKIAFAKKIGLALQQWTKKVDISNVETLDEFIVSLMQLARNHQGVLETVVKQIENFSDFLDFEVTANGIANRIPTPSTIRNRYFQGIMTHYVIGKKDRLLTNEINKLYNPLMKIVVLNANLLERKTSRPRYGDFAVKPKPELVRMVYNEFVSNMNNVSQLFKNLYSRIYHRLKSYPRYNVKKTSKDSYVMKMVVSSFIVNTIDTYVELNNKAPKGWDPKLEDLFVTITALLHCLVGNVLSDKGKISYYKQLYNELKGIGGTTILRSLVVQSWNTRFIRAIANPLFKDVIIQFK